MKYLILLLCFLWLPVQAQIPIGDPSVLPVAPIVRCEDCNPYDRDDPEVRQGVISASLVNMKACAAFGENQWGHPKSEHNCSKGQFHMVNGWGDFATYVYLWQDNLIRYDILYYGTTNAFKKNLTPVQ